MSYTLDGPEGVNFFKALSIRGQIKLVKAGMSPPRGVRKGDLMRTAQKITGKSFKPRDYDSAIAALNEWIATQQPSEEGEA